MGLIADEIPRAGCDRTTNRYGRRIVMEVEPIEVAHKINRHNYASLEIRDQFAGANKKLF